MMELKQTKKFFIFDIANNNGNEFNNSTIQSSEINIMLSAPGFGWTIPSSRQVKLHSKTIFIDDNYVNNNNEIFLSTIPGEFIINEIPNSNDIINPLLFNQAIKYVLDDYFYKKHPQYKDDLIEFYKTKKSNNRILRWNLMNITSNTSFKLHAHQNIELIYVIKGTIHELRLINGINNSNSNILSLPKYYDINNKYGPNLKDIKELLHFEHRCTTSMNNTATNNNNNTTSTTTNNNTYTSTATTNNNTTTTNKSTTTTNNNNKTTTNINNIDSYDCYLNSFLINERGSIHLTYTMEDGALLLVLWSGSHGNIPLDQYPINSDDILALPNQVMPLSS